MKLIEALKDQKSTLRKMEDLRRKIASHCADLDVMQPTYGSAQEQEKKISEWLQSHDDLALKLTDLKKKIQNTNLQTLVTIKVGDKDITRSIVEWIIRKREIIDLQLLAYSSLNDRGLSEKGLRAMGSPDEAKKLQNARVRFYFNASTRDQTIETLKTEKESIDKALEITNATIELIDRI